VCRNTHEIDPPLDHSLAVYNFFVSTGMNCSHTKFFDLTITSALTGGGLIVLGLWSC
jgi:hypothetical protein